MGIFNFDDIVAVLLGATAAYFMFLTGIERRNNYEE